MRLCGVCEEKLTLIGIGTGIGHRYHATIRVFQILFEFILEFAFPNGISAFACIRWIARLNNKSFNIPMKQATIIIVTGT